VFIIIALAVFIILRLIPAGRNHLNSRPHAEND